MRRSRFFSQLLLLMLLVTVPAVAQEEATPTFEEEVSVGYVLVPLVVRSGAGYADRLDEDDFRLLVDGKPVKVDSFERRADAPASVVFLQDLSGSMEGTSLQASQQAVQFFLDRSLKGDEFAIATFASDAGQVEVPYTAEMSVLRESVANWKAWGTTALHDAVAWVPNISAEGRNPKRFAVLITDGIDNASKFTPEKAREIVRQAQLPVYVIGLGTGNPYELSDTGDKIYRYADVLNLLASVSGGRYYAISNLEDLQEALVAIHNDLRHQYVLGFATGEGKSRLRDVKVEVKSGDRTVLFRRGYKGPPPASSKGG
ncbi:MAG TPA: VWA domain-containing protein [Thermoanaerobaculia bacterium]|jgi:Ca-activated chloride channel family protein|nr:VWA domain-containing protein [Thermoanaerobaculia bacterium]